VIRAAESQGGTDAFEKSTPKLADKYSVTITDNSFGGTVQSMDLSQKNGS
jgi:hypothetical protein